MAMSWWLFTIVVLLTACSSSSVLAAVEEDMQSFQRWMSLHSRTYSTAEEQQHRFEVYRNNMKHIRDFNFAAEHPYRLGEGPYTDLTDSEFAALLQPGSRRSPVPAVESQQTYSVGNDAVVPSSVDWREAGAVTPVREQGFCGACWAFAAVAALEGINKIRNGVLVSLSPQELVDCDLMSTGCVGGHPETAYEWMLQNGGIAAETDYPYTQAAGVCDSQKVLRQAVGIAGYQYVERYSEEALMIAVARQPVVVAINGDALHHYSRGVFDGPCTTHLNHDLTIVGYGQNEDGYPFWIAKNSWGPNWGEGGFIYLKKDVIPQPWGLCGLAIRPVFPVI